MKLYFKIGAPILVLLSLPIFYIYERLHALILTARISITLGIAIFLIFAIYLLLRHGPLLNPFQKGLVFFAAVLGIIQALYVQDLLPESVPQSGGVNMWFADGSKFEGYQPVVKWFGKSLSLAYPLQDITTDDNYAAKKSVAQTGQVTEIKHLEKIHPVRIAKNLAVSSKGVSLVLVRPKNQAPYAPIRVEIIGTDIKGSIGYKHSFDFPSDAHQKQFWISNSADEAAGISAIDIQISVLSQSETENEVLYVIYGGAESIRDYLYIIGKLLLIGFSFGGIVYSIIICCKGISFSKQLNLKYAVLPAVTLLLPMLIIAYEVGSSNDSLFTRLPASVDLLHPLDDKNIETELPKNYDRYWYKSIVLHDFIISDWRETVAVIAKHYTETYTMLPAIIPAFLMTALDHPSVPGFILIITIIYTIPAYIMIAYLAKWMVEEKSGFSSSKDYVWMFGSLVIWLGLPFFFAITLSLCLDIGGVVLFVGALLCSRQLISAIVDRSTEKTSLALIKASVGLGILLSMMYLFRRWYVLASAGIVLSGILLLLLEIWANRDRFWIICRRVFFAAPLIGFPVFLSLIWVLFEWSKNLEARNYFKTYQIYKWWGFEGVLQKFINQFGYVPFILLIVFFALWLPSRPSRENLRIVFLMIFSTIITMYLFLQIQVLIPTHNYLMMPLFGGVCAASFLLVLKRFGKLMAGCFIGIIVLGNAINTLPAELPNMKIVENEYFSHYAHWYPLEKKILLSPQEQILSWLLQPENLDKKVCTAFAPGFLTPYYVSNAWRIFPNIKKEAIEEFVNTRLIDLNKSIIKRQLLLEPINKCDIMLIHGSGYPFGALYRPKYYGFAVIYEDLLHGTGIGKAYRKESKTFPVNQYIREAFFLSNDPRGIINISVYTRTRLITDEEFDSFAKRVVMPKMATEASSTEMP